MTLVWCTVLYNGVLYCTVLWCTVLDCGVVYCTVQWCTVLYCTVCVCVCQVMKRLLNISCEFWSRYVNFADECDDHDDVYPQSSESPEY